MIDLRFVKNVLQREYGWDIMNLGSVLNTVLICLLTAIGAGAQSTEPPEVKAARVCAEGYKLYEQKHYAEAEARFLAGIVESEKIVKATSMRGGCQPQARKGKKR